MNAMGKMRTTIASAFLLMVSIGGVSAGTDEEGIKELLMETFDKPGARLVVDPVVVAGDHAIADWSQATLGGRALLRRRVDKWTLILCSGDGIISADALQQAGVPKDDAVNLSARLKAAESTMSVERRALLATFEGTVLMGTNDHPGDTQVQNSRN